VEKACLGGPFRLLARDYEWLGPTLSGLRYLAFGILMLAKLVVLIGES
jgi:hypothetical protein